MITGNVTALVSPSIWGLSSRRDTVCYNRLWRRSTARSQQWVHEPAGLARKSGRLWQLCGRISDNDRHRKLLNCGKSGIGRWCDRNCSVQRRGIPNADSDADQDAHANSEQNANRKAIADPHPGAHCDKNAHQDTHANSEQNANCKAIADSHPGADRDKNGHQDAHANPEQDSHRDAVTNPHRENPDTNGDQNADRHSNQNAVATPGRRKYQSVR